MEALIRRYGNEGYYSRMTGALPLVATSCWDLVGFSLAWLWFVEIVVSQAGDEDQS